MRIVGRVRPLRRLGRELDLFFAPHELFDDPPPDLDWVYDAEEELGR